MRRLPLLHALLVLLVCTACTARTASARQQAPRVTQADLIERLIDLNRLTTPPTDGERSGLFSSRDHEGDGAGAKPRFLSKTADGWDVLAELKSPGAITRFWCGEPAGKLRVIVDGKTAIDGEFADIFRGGIDPFGEPISYLWAAPRGGVSYLPIGFARSLKVMTRDFAGAYQIDYTTFPEGTEVEPFSQELSKEAEEALRRVTGVMRAGLSEKRLFAGGKMMTGGTAGELKQNEKLTWDSQRSGTVRAMFVSLTDAHEPQDPYYLRDLMLRIWWDGRETPDIEAPLTDFFGSGFDRNSNLSLPMGSSRALDNPTTNQNQGLWYYCFFPMPFTNSIKIEIENRNRKKIGVACFVRIDRNPPAEGALRFRARFASASNVGDLLFGAMGAVGRGRLVGTTLSVDCPRKEWWGAGETRVELDDVKRPLVGTDVAGFFGIVAEPNVRSRALQGVTLANLQGKSSYYRWMISDAASFFDHARVAFRNRQPGGAADMYYSSVVYWYGAADAADEFGKALAESARPPGLRVAGAQEVEGNIEGKGWGSVVSGRFSGEVEFSGDAAASISTTQPVTMTVTAEKAGRYTLKLRTHPKRSFQTIDVKTEDGKLIGNVEYRRAPDGVFVVGEFEARAGKNKLIVTCSKTAVLDYWLLEPPGEAAGAAATQPATSRAASKSATTRPASKPATSKPASPKPRGGG